MAFNDTKLDHVTGELLYRPKSRVYSGSSYPRVAALDAHGADLIATCEAFELHGFPIFRSCDSGRSWTPDPIAVVTELDPVAAADGWRLEWQPTLYADGDRVLLAGASILVGPSEEIEGTRIVLAESDDAGATWNSLSTVAESDRLAGNVWEPEILRVGSSLIVFYSSEAHRHEGINQGIVHRVSTDGGHTWGPEVLDVYAKDGHSRPGMPIVRRLPDESFVMAYELCNSDGGLCPIYLSRTTDAQSWSPSPLQEQVAVSASHYLHATPAVAVLDDRLVVGSMGAAGFDQRTLLGRSVGGGAWHGVASPVQWQGGNDHAGYSPTLHPVRDGLLVMASSADPDVINEIRYATLPDGEGRSDSE